MQSPAQARDPDHQFAEARPWSRQRACRLPPSPPVAATTAASRPHENKISVEEVPDYYPADYADDHRGLEGRGWRARHLLQHLRGELGADLPRLPEEVPVGREGLRERPRQRRGLPAGALRAGHRRLARSTWSSRTPPARGPTSPSATERLMDYQSPELDQLPDFAQLLPNVYAMSTDPMTIAYNTELMPEAPTGIASLADIAEADPDKFQDKITVRDPESCLRVHRHPRVHRGQPRGLGDLERLLPFTRAETSSGTQMEKILAGEYLAGFFISGGPAFPVVDDSDGLVEVVYPDDGTTVLPRGIGIAADAPHPATVQAVPRLPAVRGGPVRGRRGRPVLLPRGRRGPRPAHLPGGRRRGRRGQGHLRGVRDHPEGRDRQLARAVLPVRRAGPGRRVTRRADGTIGASTMTTVTTAPQAPENQPPEQFKRAALPPPVRRRPRPAHAVRRPGCSWRCWCSLRSSRRSTRASSTAPSTRPAGSSPSTATSALFTDAGFGEVILEHRCCSPGSPRS